MYINDLIIKKTIPNTEIIRKISFKKGLNFIVDNSKTSNEKGNNVGKTTVLKIIDLCFAAQNRKSLWFDTDTNSTNNQLKEYLHDGKIYAELNISTSSSNHTLRVELFEKGKRYIDGEKLSYSNYKLKLNEITFQNSQTKPTIRQLIGKFIRIGQSAESGNILKYLNQNVSYAEYRNVYNYLFNLTDSQDSSIALELEQNISKEQNDLNNLIRLHNFSNIDDLNERIKIVNKSASSYQEKLNYLLENKFTQESFQKRDKVEELLLKIDTKIDRLSFEKAKVSKIISDISSKSTNLEIDNSLLKDLFNETQNEFGKLNKKFNDLINFNEAITKNKLDYYNEKLTNIESDFIKFSTYRSQIIEQNKEIFEIIDKNKFMDFEDFHAKLIEQNQLLGELQKVKNIYNNLLISITSNKKELDTLINKKKQHDNLSKFNNYFTPLSDATLNQRLYLTKDNDFPLKLSNVEDGLGTGNKKTITLLIDISYVSFIKEVKLDFPKFFIHDILETVDQSSFKTIVETINSNGSQFITAVLKEKIKDYDFINQENDIRLELAINDKLFKI